MLLLLLLYRPPKCFEIFFNKIFEIFEKKFSKFSILFSKFSKFRVGFKRGIFVHTGSTYGSTYGVVLQHGRIPQQGEGEPLYQVPFLRCAAWFSEPAFGAVAMCL